MPTIRTVTALAAGGANANVLQGNQFEFIQTPSRVQVFAVQEGAGVGEIEVFFGQELQLPQTQPNLRAAGAGGPSVQDDGLVDDYAAPGDRLVVRVAETGGAAVTALRVLVKITPMAM